MGKVTVRGVDNLLYELERRLGKQKMRRKVDKALIAGARVIVEEIKSNFQSFKHTGASIDELTFSKPMYLNGIRTIKIHWKGPKNRYAIIHLNEHGTIRQPNPRGKGAVERSLRSGQEEYFRVLRNELAKG